MLSALENTKYKKEGKTHVFYPPLGSLSLPCKLRFVTMLTVDIQVTSSQTLCGDETVPVRNQMASRYNNAMVEIKETDCPTIAQIESPIYIIFLFVKVFQLSTQLYFQQAGRLLSGRPDPSERKTLGGDCFMLDSKSNIYQFSVYISVGAGEQHQKY